MTYQYRCAECGSFDLVRPMGEAGPEARCTGCGGPARRVFTAPSLTRPGDPRRRALAASEASSYEPQVVNQVPPARRRPAPPRDPRHATLPRL